MIDPTRITQFDRTDDELQEFLLFCVAVAGKRSDSVAPKVHELVSRVGPQPLHRLRENRAAVPDLLRSIGIAPYERTIPAVCGVLDLDPRTCTLEELVAVRGVGPKTARMFLLHSRPEQDWVVLDVHILRWLRGVCRMRRIPRSTPSGCASTYCRIEDKARRKVRELFPAMSFAEFDLNTWRLMSGRN